MLGFENAFAASEIRARTGNLAQASQTRLRESGGGLPRPFARAVAQAGGLGFERETALLRRGELA